MKTFQRIMIVVIILAVIAGVIYLARGTAIGGSLWVMLSSAYAAFFIILSKLKNFFTGGDSPSIAELEDRHEDIKRIEKDLIDTLMKERQVFQERLARLEDEGASLDSRIAQQKEVLEDYADFDTWQANVWDEKTEEEKKALEEDTFGEEISLEDFRIPDV